jgi:hypothetical protein
MDCGAQKQGLLPCMRKKGHEGKHLAFAKVSTEPFEMPVEWDETGVTKSPSIRDDEELVVILRDLL